LMTHSTFPDFPRFFSILQGFCDRICDEEERQD
jgi:hypothetical protein